MVTEVRTLRQPIGLCLARVLIKKEGKKVCLWKPQWRYLLNPFQIKGTSSVVISCSRLDTSIMFTSFFFVIFGPPIVSELAKEARKI